MNNSADKTSIASIAPDPATPKLASAPLDDPRGDVILRTSDNVDFRVVKVILEFASPVFKDMFSLPQPSINDEGALQPPIISISESSAVIDTVLRICYPIETPDLNNADISLIIDILATAKKYDIISVIAPVRSTLTWRTRPEATEKDVMAVYAIACHFRMIRVARKAAVACLKWPIPGLDVPQLDLMTARDYYNLVKFHKLCSDTLAMETYTTAFQSIHPGGHYCPQSVFYREGSRLPWWAAARSLLQSVTKDTPFDTSKFTLTTIASALRDSGCDSCKNHALRDGDFLKNSITTSVKGAIDKVSLESSWERPDYVAKQI